MNNIRYGCYDPKHVWEYTFKCDGCRETVSPQRGYGTTTGSPGYIFICPECSHTAFAYRSDKAQSLVK